jgi:AcrR family transcriptional regulator
MAKKSGAASPARHLDFLWGTRERPTRGPRPGLSLERVVEAAISIADSDGINAVSMQRVATELGFATMALYRYVPGKNELIGVMIDTALGEPPIFDDESSGWRPRMEQWARQMWAIFYAHPWALGVSGPGRLMGPNELGWLEVAVATLAETGLTGSEQTDAVLAVSGHVRTWAQYSIYQSAVEAGEEQQWAAGLGELVARHENRYPALMAAISSPPDDDPASSGQEFGLRCVLDGIGVRIAERLPAST